MMRFSYKIWILLLVMIVAVTAIVYFANQCLYTKKIGINKSDDSSLVNESTKVPSLPEILTYVFGNLMNQGKIRYLINKVSIIQISF